MNERPAVLVIGNFDGVHRGHLALFGEARRLADDYDARVVAVTFTEHPVNVLRPTQAPPQVMHRHQKEEALRDAGADAIRWLEPTADLLGLAPERFIEQMVGEQKTLAVVEGQNFHFGRARAGDTKLLRELGRRLDFEVIVSDLVRVALVDKTIAPVSSTLVRWLLSHGRIADATRCLGRPWVLSGPVVSGEQRGRTLHAPTANLDLTPQMLPADGVYACRTRLAGREHLVALSVGLNPTFSAQRRTCEAFVLDYDGELYGKTLTVELIRWLRDQWRFADAQALRAQIGHDVATIRTLAASGLIDPADANIHVEHVIAHD